MGKVFPTDAEGSVDHVVRGDGVVWSAVHGYVARPHDGHVDLVVVPIALHPHVFVCVVRHPHPAPPVQAGVCEGVRKEPFELVSEEHTRSDLLGGLVEGVVGAVGVFADAGVELVQFWGMGDGR